MENAIQERKTVTVKVKIVQFAVKGKCEVDRPSLMAGFYEGNRSVMVSVVFDLKLNMINPSHIIKILTIHRQDYIDVSVAEIELRC